MKNISLALLLSLSTLSFAEEMPEGVRYSRNESYNTRLAIGNSIDQIANHQKASRFVRLDFDYAKGFAIEQNGMAIGLDLGNIHGIGGPNQSYINVNAIGMDLGYGLLNDNGALVAILGTIDIEENIIDGANITNSLQGTHIGLGGKIVVAFLPNVHGEFEAKALLPIDGSKISGLSINATLESIISKDLDIKYYAGLRGIILQNTNDSASASHLHFVVAGFDIPVGFELTDGRGNNIYTTAFVEAGAYGNSGRLSPYLSVGISIKVGGDDRVNKKKK